MLILGVIAITLVILVVYSMIRVGSQADARLKMITNRKFWAGCLPRLEDKMESQREVLRTIEKEIEKGSAPVYFDGMEFRDGSYQLVESQAKLNQLLDYFFRNGEYALLADRQIKSNVYMDVIGRKPTFRSAKSELDRGAMELAAKRWIKRRHPSFDGDVYVENTRCYLTLSEEEMEKRMCRVNGQDTTALIFTKKHLTGLYLQFLINRKEAVLHKGYLEGGSDTSNRIYRLEGVEVLFQCLLMDQMEMEDGRLYVQFNTVYLLEKGKS